MSNFNMLLRQHNEQLFMQNLGLVPGVEMVDFPWNIID